MVDNTFTPDPTAPAVDVNAPVVPSAGIVSSSSATPSADPVGDAIAEFKNNQQYEDRPISAFAEGLGSGLSFGILPQVLVKSGLVDQNALNQIVEKNPEAEIAGQVTGALAPALVSGGSSLIAKGVQGAGAAVLATSELGSGVESITAQALKNLLKVSGNSKTASSIITNALSKGAGSAVMGAAYGLGNLINENALGNADFNAENAVSSIGTGAVLGGSIGALFGGAQSTIGKWIDAPSIEKAPVSFIDPQKQSFKYLNMNAKAVSELSDATKQALPQTLVDTAKRGFLLSSKNEVGDNITNARQETGQAIGKIIDQLDTFGDANPNLLPKVGPTAQKIVDNLDKTLINDRFSFGSNSNIPDYDAKLKPIIDLRNSYQDIANNPANATETFTPSKLNQIREDLNDVVNYDKTFGESSLMDKAHRVNASTLRSVIDDLALTASTDPALQGSQDLFSDLKNLNKNYGVLSEIEPYAIKASGKSSPGIFSGLVNAVRGGVAHAIGGNWGLSAEAAREIMESDMVTKMKILIGLEKGNQAITQGINSASKGFIYGSTQAPAAATTLGTLDSPYFKEEFKGKSPKNDSEAINNLNSNLSSFHNDPTSFITNIRSTTAGIGAAAPQTQAALVSQVIKNMQYIQNSMPADNRSPSVLNQSFTPSSIDMNHLHETIQNVDNPMSIVSRFQHGNASANDLQVLQNLYPNIYSTLNTSVMGHLSDAQKKDSDFSLPYEKQLQLQSLLGQAANGSSPELLQNLQNNFAPQQLMPLQKTPGQLAKFNTGATATPLQNTMERK